MSARALKLVDLSVSLAPGRPWLRPLAPLLERLLALDAVNDIYARLGGRGLGTDEFCREVLRDLDVRMEVPSGDVARLAAVQGPCVVVANHPLGGRDALALNLLLGRARTDYRVMANHLLAPVAEVRPRLILVDPFAGAGSAARNLGPLKEARRWLEAGGLMGLFPAGEVSLWQEAEGRVADGPWSGTAVRLALAGGATLVPVHIEGRGSLWLRLLAWLHPSFKTPFLARELMHGPCRRLSLRVGRPVPAQALPHPGDPEAAAAWLRGQCYSLAGDLDW